MLNLPNTNSTRSRLPNEQLYSLLSYFRGRRGLILLAVIGGAAAFKFNWEWLVLVGAAPLILAVLPCAAMCGLGLCMKRFSPGAGPVETGGADQTALETTLAETPPQYLLPDQTGENKVTARPIALPAAFRSRAPMERKSIDV